MPPLAYIVASTPRCGSSLLCEGLAATGDAGVPDEIFAPHLRRDFCGAWGVDDTAAFEAYLGPALRYATSGNGVTAFKIHWMHVPELAAEAGYEPDDVLSAILPGARFVNIVRRDRRAQALSWFRADATDEWFSFGAPSAFPAAAPTLDAAAVLAFERRIEFQQEAWLAYFANHGVVPLTVEYEALAEDYRREVGRVLAFLGLDASAADAIPQPRRRRQADGITDSWRRQLERAGVAR